MHAASSLETVLRVAGPLVKRLGNRISLTSLVFGGVGATLAFYSFRFGLIHALSAGGFKRVCAIFALAGPVAVAGYVSLGPALRDAYQRMKMRIRDLWAHIRSFRQERIGPRLTSARTWLRAHVRWPRRRR